MGSYVDCMQWILLVYLGQVFQHRFQTLRVSVTFACSLASNQSKLLYPQKDTMTCYKTSITFQLLTRERCSISGQ